MIDRGTNRFVQGTIPTDLQLDLGLGNGHSGAIAHFLGVIRHDEHNGQKVVCIEYSAYETMANKILLEIEEEIKQKFEITSIRIYHSIGKVAVAEPSMLVTVHSRHRKEAFQALEHTVDLIKAYAPVWKKEIFTDGSHRWVNCDHCHSPLFDESK